jgi:hypothetical protein
MALWACKTCGAKAPLQELVKHDAAKDKDAKPTYAKTCEKSPLYPHGTDKPKK